MPRSLRPVTPWHFSLCERHHCSSIWNTQRSPNDCTPQGVGDGAGEGKDVNEGVRRFMLIFPPGAVEASVATLLCAASGTG